MKYKEVSNIIKFPRKVQISTLFNAGLYGLTVDNIEKVTVKDAAIYIWFYKDENDRVWDLSLEYETSEEARSSYDDLVNNLRKIRFKTL